MDPLRWILLAGVLLVIAGLYGLEMWRRRRNADSDPDAAERDAELLQDLEDRRGLVDGNADLDLGALSGLAGSRGDRDELDLDDLDTLVAERDAHDGGPVDPGAVSVRRRESRMYSVEPAAPRATEELIVVLNVMAEPGDTFAGPDFLEAAERVGMEYGDMQIFHHHGLGETHTPEPVFSLANILEPGFFEPEHMEEFTSPGFCMFMRLPGPLDGPVAFELLLSTGQRLADALGGELRDDTRSVLTPQTITHLRERVAEHGRRQLAGATPGVPAGS